MNEISHANNPPPRKAEWQHSEQVLVYYPATEEQCAKFGIAYYHYDPPFNGPKWVDFDNFTRTPICWWKLPSPPNA